VAISVQAGRVPPAVAAFLVSVEVRERLQFVSDTGRRRPGRAVAEQRADVSEPRPVHGVITFATTHRPANHTMNTTK
jgi:hypothetical protein